MKSLTHHFPLQTAVNSHTELGNMDSQFNAEHLTLNFRGVLSTA